MRCTCDKWIELIRPGERVHIRGEEITYCPFCELKLIKDNFTVFITYDGPEDKSKEDGIVIALAPHIVHKAPGKKKLYLDIQLP